MENFLPIQPSEPDTGFKSGRKDYDLSEEDSTEKPKKNKELKRSKIQILLGKKRSNFALSSALIASISLMAFSGSEKPSSQALVQVDHQDMPLLQSTAAFDFDLAQDFESRELSLNIGQENTDKQLYASYSNQLIPVNACRKEEKPEPTHHFSLADTYMAYDVRESYL